MCSPNVNDFWFISLIQFTFNDTVCSQTNQSHWCTSSGTASNLVRLGVPIRGASLLIGRMLLSICTGQPWLFTLGRINSVPWVGQWLSPWLTTCWPPHCPAWSRTEVISCVATQCMLPTAPLLWWWLFVALATVVMSGRDRHSNVQWMTAVAKNDTDPGRPLIFGAQCILWLWMVQWLMKVRQTNETWEHVTVFVWLGINMSWWQWLNEWKWESNFRRAFGFGTVSDDPTLLIHNLWHGMATWVSFEQGNVTSTSKTGSAYPPVTSTSGEAWGICQVGSAPYCASASC